jgi:hypothetical protein
MSGNNLVRSHDSLLSNPYLLIRYDHLITLGVISSVLNKLIIYPEDECNRILRNISKYLRNYKMSYPRGQQSS